MYETCTVDDVGSAYDLFDFTDKAMFTCIGTSGKAAPAANGGKIRGGVRGRG